MRHDKTASCFDSFQWGLERRVDLHVRCKYWSTYVPGRLLHYGMLALFMRRLRATIELRVSRMLLSRQHRWESSPGWLDKKRGKYKVQLSAVMTSLEFWPAAETHATCNLRHRQICILDKVVNSRSSTIAVAL